MYDVIIIGCGFAGATTARKLADDCNKKVLILEKRAHIAGNMYDAFNKQGIKVHMYGPHIFHTDIKHVFDYLGKFTEWRAYEHRVLGKIDGNLVPIPFNFKSVDMLFSGNEAVFIKNKLLECFPGKKKVLVFDLLNHENADVQKFGNYVYNKVFVNYTAKQWGVHHENIDKSVVSRVPVVLGYDDRYFDDGIQYMPKNGYVPLFQKMLDHKNITVELNCDAHKRISFENKNNAIYFDGQEVKCPIVYTGAIDELMDYRFGRLPYRSLNMMFENHAKTTFQRTGVVNFPNEEKYTRITEFKYLTGQVIDGKTTIMKEYPLAYDINNKKADIPYYPVIQPDNINLYERYKSEMRKYDNMYLCGRLAEYKYYNMDAVVDRALKIARKIKREYS